MADTLPRGIPCSPVVDATLYLVEDPLSPPVGASWHPLLGRDGMIIPLYGWAVKFKGRHDFLWVRCPFSVSCQSAGHRVFPVRRGEQPRAPRRRAPGEQGRGALRSASVPHPDPRPPRWPGSAFQDAVRTASALLHRKWTPRCVGGTGWGEEAPAGRKRGWAPGSPSCVGGQAHSYSATPLGSHTRFGRTAPGLLRVALSSLVEGPRDTGSRAIGLRVFLSPG